MDVIVVTGADARYFGYAQDLVRSIVAIGRSDLAIGFYDLGIEPGQRAWLEGEGASVVRPRTLLRGDFEPDAVSGQMGYLARPFLRENFPGYRTYVWLDADIWLQTGEALRLFVEAAGEGGAALVRQNDPAYRFWPWLEGWKLKHFCTGYGLVSGLRLTMTPHINNGAFAMGRDAPHWEAWRARYQGALARTGRAAPHDQFGLNAAVTLDRLPTTFLPTTCNWICDLAAPIWDPEARLFRSPTGRHEAISVMHLAGPAKTGTFKLRSTGGGIVETGLRYGAADGLA